MTVTVRPATPADLHAVARLAGKLVRLHHAFDARRFMLVESVEQGYERFFGHEVREPRAVIVVATDSERGDAVVGYAYGRMEERDWNNLLDACGAVHDIYVDETARRAGVAKALMNDVLARLRALGAPRVVLHAAWPNENAQHLFESLGFRKTMVEMTLDFDGEGDDAGAA
jgi:ribosomal protein S18 acetylase RimI-like enzyme